MWLASKGLMKRLKLKNNVLIKLIKIKTHNQYQYLNRNHQLLLRILLLHNDLKGIEWYHLFGLGVFSWGLGLFIAFLHKSF